MKKSLLAILALGLVVSLVGGASAHIGDRLFLIFELTEADIADIDLRDVGIADWEEVIGEPSVLASDMFADPGVGEGAPYNPADLDYRIWMAWNGARNTIWVGHERIDDVYINEWDGADFANIWRHDSFEFMLDGDHSGGDYSAAANPEWTEEEQRLNNNRTAQQYVAIAESPSGRHIGYQGHGTEWVILPPYADAGGGAYGVDPTVAILEFYVTAFDDLIYYSPEESRPSTLVPGKIIGFQISVPDFDSEPAVYRAFHTLSGQGATWRFADRFVDGLLVGSGETSVESNSWGRIKASFGE